MDEGSSFWDRSSIAAEIAGDSNQQRETKQAPLPDRVSLRSCVDNWATAAYNIDVNEAYKGALSWHLFK
jgi:hypothetical protein